MSAILLIALLFGPAILTIGVQSLARATGGRRIVQWAALLCAAACVLLLLDHYSTPWLEQNDRLGFSAILVPGIWLALVESLLVVAFALPLRLMTTRYLAWEKAREEITRERAQEEKSK